LKNLLIIGPIPPPVTGQSVATKVLVDDIAEYYSVNIVNTSKNSFKQGLLSFGRIFQIFAIITQVVYRSNWADIVYLGISQSLAGNVRDLILFWLCRKKKLVVHLHGGGLHFSVFYKSSFLLKLNRFFYKKYIDRVIVLSESLKKVFSLFEIEEKIVTLENYADDYLFLNKVYIEEKKIHDTLNILYLSNMLEEKGYKLLFEAVSSLSDEVNIELHFVGKFDNLEDEKDFQEKIAQKSGFFYHGPVFGKERIPFFQKAHIFCLPTYYPFGEGQPISILEAYASGCYVVSTKWGGIPDILEDGVNGSLIPPNDRESLANAIRQVINNPSEFERIKLHNSQIAKEKYTKEVHLQNIRRIFKEIYKRIEMENIHV